MDPISTIKAREMQKYAARQHTQAAHYRRMYDAYGLSIYRRFWADAANAAAVYASKARRHMGVEQ